MSKYTEFAKMALELVGGRENVVHVAHCTSRLRITFKSTKATEKELWDAQWIEENLKELGCIGVVPKDKQVQFIIGPNVDDAYKEFCDLANWNGNAGTDIEEEDEAAEEEKHDIKWAINRFGNFAGPIFMPLVPALIVGGVILSLRYLAVNYFNLDTSSGTANLLLSIYEAGYYFLPIYLGYTMSKQLNMPPILGMMLGGVMLSPRYTSGVITDFFGINILQASYSSTIIPIILGCFFLSFIYKKVKKVVPEVMTVFLTPLITMIIVVPIQLIILGPLGNYLSTYVGNAIVWFGNTLGFISTPLLSFIYPYLVMLGLDKTLFAIGTEIIATRGFNNVTGAIGFISNICIGATALAISRTIKNKEQKGMIASFGVTALCGVTEPAFYGACIQRPKALIGTAIGAITAGLFAGITGLRTFVLGGCPGWLTLTYFIDPNGGLRYVILAAITAAIATIVSFVATTIILKVTDKSAKEVK